ncbi:MAG: hypothetical protein ACHQ01_08345 [Candidatus Limnocylindrales bacterium]
MGFLRRLTGGGRQSPPPGAQEWPAPGPITTWPVGETFSAKFAAVVFLRKEGGTVDVSGESDYQDTLEIVSGGRTPKGVRNPDHVAILLPEPSSAPDPDAVRVVIVPTRSGQPWGKVGYLSREDAVRYRPVIDRVASIGKVTACHVSLDGGWERGPEDRGDFGVTLHLDMPAQLMLELDRELRA